MKPDDNDEDEGREDTADFIVSSQPSQNEEHNNGISLRAATLEKLVEFCAREFGKSFEIAEVLRLIQETKNL